MQPLSKREESAPRFCQGEFHAVLLAALLLGACGGGGGGPASPPVPPINPNPVLVGAGDIAACYSNGDEITAALLDAIPGTVFAAGDIAYDDGTHAEFRDCYDPSWGRHKARTRPVPGNHDYHTVDAVPYFTYFGVSVGSVGTGYYSYNLGSWHIIALNSNVGVDTGSAQAAWLRADLAANPAACTLAYWHHPLFSSGEHGNHIKMDKIWGILDTAGVDVVVNGHDHDYERFAPQNAAGEPDPTGMREFVVGTGGESLRPFAQLRSNSVVRESDTFGVLKFVLRPTSYEWEFVPEPGKTFRDSGSALCNP